jgi:processive 1,2-diacylglycerol beta-glucosyltransferase
MITLLVWKIMVKNILGALGMSLLVLFALSAMDLENNSSLKKKALIFSTKGGGGHSSASLALSDYLKDDFTVIVCPIFDVLGSVDPVQAITEQGIGTRKTSDDAYNYLLKNRYTSTINKLSKTASWSLPYMKEKILRALLTIIALQKPSLIISVIPLFNAPLLELAKKFRIPFIIITVDFDTSAYVTDLRSPYPSNFYYMLPFEDKELREKIADSAIPDNQIIIGGFPLRSQFYEQKDPIEIKKHYNIPSDKPVIMIMMGATGSDALISCIKAIAHMHIPLYLIVCLGRSAELENTIKEIQLPKEIVCVVKQFFERISDLMAISDVLITKTGATTIAEALHMKLPVLLDCTQDSVWWESFNVELIQKYQLGDIFTKFDQLPQLLAIYVSPTPYRDNVKKNIAELIPNRAPEVIKSFIANINS